MCHTDIGCFNSFNRENQGRALVFLLLYCLCSVQCLLIWAIQTEGIIKWNVLCSSKPIYITNMSTQPWSWGVNLIWNVRKREFPSLISQFRDSTEAEMGECYILFVLSLAGFSILFWSTHPRIHQCKYSGALQKVKNSYDNMWMPIK